MPVALCDLKLIHGKLKNETPFVSSGKLPGGIQGANYCSGEIERCHRGGLDLTAAKPTRGNEHYH